MGTPIDYDPPRDLEAERMTLGSMLLDNASIHEIGVILFESDFMLIPHQHVFRAIVELDKAGSPVDPVLVREQMIKHGTFDRLASGESSPEQALVAIFENIVTAANARYYAEIVRDRAIRRRAVSGAIEIANSASNLNCSVEELTSVANRRMLELSDSKSSRVTEISNHLAALFEEIETRKAGGEHKRRVSSGFQAYDNLTGGLHAGELVICAARTSVGKTTFALNVAHHLVVENRHPVLFVSLEQSRYEIAERLLCMISGVDSLKMKSGRYGSDEIVRFMDAGAHLRKSPLFVDDIPSQTVFHIFNTARMVRAKHGLSLVIVDYLSMLQAPEDSRRQQREETVAANTRALKRMARDLDCPVLVLVQLNRESAKNEDQRPRLHHLRESGAIENDADAVLLLWRKEDSGSTLNCCLEKQRNGPRGEFRLDVKAHCYKFLDYSQATGDDYTNGH